MGEENLALFRAEFNRSLRVESRPERLRGAGPRGEVGDVADARAAADARLVRRRTRRAMKVAPRSEG